MVSFVTVTENKSRPVSTRMLPVLRSAARTQSASNLSNFLFVPKKMHKISNLTSKKTREKKALRIFYLDLHNHRYYFQYKHITLIHLFLSLPFAQSFAFGKDMKITSVSESITPRCQVSTKEYVLVQTNFSTGCKNIRFNFIH